MVNMTHHCDDGGSRTRFAFHNQRGFQLFFKHIFANKLNTMAHFLNDQGRSVLINGLIDRRHHPQPHENLDHFASFDRHSRCQLPNSDNLANFHFS